MLRVLVVSGVRVFRDALLDVLVREPGIEAVGAAAEETAAREWERLRPDVLVLDASSARSRGVRAVAEAAQGSAVLAIGLTEVESDILPMVEAGVVAFLRSDASTDELLAAIHRVGSGDIVCSAAVARVLLRAIASGWRSKGDRPQSELSPRQTEVARLLAAGLTNKEIAARLSLDVTTVKTHVHSILAKLGVPRREDIPRVLLGLLSDGPVWARRELDVTR